MTPPLAGVKIGRMDDELARLEGKVQALIAHAEALREANALLLRDLANAREQNRVLTQRMKEASARLDALIARLPAEPVQP